MCLATHLRSRAVRRPSWARRRESILSIRFRERSSTGRSGSEGVQVLNHVTAQRYVPGGKDAGTGGNHFQPHAGFRI